MSHFGHPGLTLSIHGMMSNALTFMVHFVNWMPPLLKFMAKNVYSFKSITFFINNIGRTYLAVS